MLNKYLIIINEIRLLKSLSLEVLDSSFKSGQSRIKKYKKNAMLHYDGEKCDKIEIILKGKINIERIDIEGNLLTVAAFTKGNILGGNLVFSTKPVYLMTVVATTDVEILEIDKDILMHWLTTQTNFLKAFLEYVSDHSTILGNKIKNHIKKSIRECLINFIQHQYDIQNTVNLKLPFSKKALAETIGVQRTSLSRELQKMKNDGLIDFDNKSITIIDKNIIDK